MKIASFFGQKSKNEIPQKSVLHLSLPNQIMTTLFVKLMRMQQYLRANPKATHLELMKIAEPHLTKFYESLLKLKKNAVEIFDIGFKMYYGDPTPSNELQTMQTAQQTIQTLHGKSISLAELESSSTIDKCLSDLELINKQQMQVQWSVSEFQTSFNIASFKEFQ